MPIATSIVLLGLLCGISEAQCIAGSPGTNCSGPLSVQPQAGNLAQSAISLVDLGLAVPAPAVGQYTLSIAGGMLLESDDGSDYHSLAGAPGAPGEAGPVGARGAKGVPGPAGAQGSPGTSGTMAAPSDYGFSGWGSFSAAAGTSEVGNSLYRNQIDMTNAAVVRLVRVAERELRSGGVLAGRIRLDCTVRDRTGDDALRDLQQWLAGVARGSERRLCGSHCYVQQRDQHDAMQPVPVAFAV